MKTRWIVATFVSLDALTLVACDQHSTAVEMATEETRITRVDPKKIFVAGTPLRVAVGELTVLETFEKATGKVIGSPRLKGTVTLENVGTDRSLRLLRGDVIYLGADGKAISVAAGQEAPALNFVGRYASDTLNPGQLNDQPIDVAYPVGAATEKSVKSIRIHVTYLASPYETQTFEVPVKMP